MLIITLLAIVLLTPITTQVTQAKISQAKTDLDQINEALIGFALAQTKPYLPCPDTDNDGVADACLTTFTTETTGGNIPWVTLNVPATDPWGQRYQYRVNNAYTNSVAGFTLTTAPSGAARVYRGGERLHQGVRVGDSEPAMGRYCQQHTRGYIFPQGPEWTKTAATSPDEMENRDGDCLFVSHTYSGAAGNEFDDMFAWLSPGVLMSRMVTAQKLP